MMAPDVSTDEGRSDGAKRVALAAARGLDEAKCEDIVVIDVRNVSQVTFSYLMAFVVIPFLSPAIQANEIIPPKGLFA